MLPLLLTPDYINQENKQFRRMLSYIFERVSWSKNQPSIVNIACGKCYEMEVLLELSPHIIAIDERKKAIESIRQRYQHYKIEFHVSDARKLSEIVKGADFILARHPNVGKDDWKKIYRSCYKITHSGGLLVSTYYSNLDFDIAQPLVKKAGYKIKMAEENPFCIPYTDTISPFKIGADRFLIAAMRDN